MKKMRKIIKIDEELCDGCGNCVPSCAEGALVIEDGKAKVVEDRFCDGLGACLGECPNGALQIIEREADDFDEQAVEEYLKKMEKREKESPACGCPSNQIQSFVPVSVKNDSSGDMNKTVIDSALTHWPVKIRLIPPKAPFLRGADLLVLADCVPAAYTALHSDLMKGKTVMMGCPKFDEVDDYIEKFRQIFETAGIKSITSAIMEVPCCSGLPYIVKKGLEAAKKDIPMKTIVISARGEILEKR